MPNRELCAVDPECFFSVFWGDPPPHKNPARIEGVFGLPEKQTKWRSFSRCSCSSCDTAEAGNMADNCECLQQTQTVRQFFKTIQRLSFCQIDTCTLLSRICHTQKLVIKATKKSHRPLFVCFGLSLPLSLTPLTPGSAKPDVAPTDPWIR